MNRAREVGPEALCALCVGGGGVGFEEEEGAEGAEGDEETRTCLFGSAVRFVGVVMVEVIVVWAAVDGGEVFARAHLGDGGPDHDGGLSS